MRFTMRSTPTKLACLLLLAAVAGCQAGGIGADDASGQPRVATEQPFSAATRRPAGATARKDVAGTGAPGRRVAAAEGASSEAGVARAPASERARTPAGTGAAPGVGSDTTAARPAEVTRAGVRETGGASPAARLEATPAADPVEIETSAAAGEAVGVGPAAGTGPPVAEPPRGSNFWLWFFTILVVVLVGTAGWFFLQPPWKRGRWWRLLKAYVRDWRAGGLDVTPPRGSPSLGPCAS